MNVRVHIEDRRTKDGTPAWGYVVCTDSFLSGWGGARGGRSLFALAVESLEEMRTVIDNAERRTDMKRPRHVMRTKADGTPKIKVGPRDHLAIVDRGDAGRFYIPGGF